ncbi:MAG: YciI family protein [Lysobacter sp.]|nr:YciI family protein [Lysobacter sp.]
MRVMVMVKATPQSEAGEMPGPALFEAMGRFNEELMQAGVLLAADGLKPSARGARVRFDGAQRTVLDGPFAETRELVAGFWLWQVRSLEEAIEWARRCPNPFEAGVSEIEIRPLYETEDFGEEVGSGMHARKAQLREQLAARG